MLKIMPPAGWKQGPLHQPGTLLLFGGQGHSSLHGCRVLGTGESWLFSGGRWAELMLEKSMEEPVVSLGTSTWERRNLVLVLDCSEPGDTGRVPRVWDKHPHVCALVWAKKRKGLGKIMMEWRVGHLFQLGATNRHRGKRPPTSCGSSPQAEGNISSRMRPVQRLWHRTPKSPRCDQKQCVFTQKAFQSIHCSFSAHIYSRSHARAPCQLSFAGGTGIACSLQTPPWCLLAGHVLGPLSPGLWLSSASLLTYYLGAMLLPWRMSLRKS